MSGNNEEIIMRNLIDAGCQSETAEEIMNNFREDKISEGLKLLAAHRRRLLEELHREQKQIDCLDYLVYKMKKENSL